MNLITFAQSVPPQLSSAQGGAEESLNILDLAVKGGWIMVVLAILSLIGIYLFIERFTTLRKAMKKNPMLIARIKDDLKSNDIESAYNYCEKQNTPVSRVLAKGVKDYRFDPVSIRQALDNNAGLEIANLEKGLPVISTIAAVAPMLGFLGTVTGMIQAFWNMSNAGSDIQVTALSGGIYEAMVTTVAGLIVGIVAIFSYNYLVSLVDKVQNIIESQIISFLEVVAECKNNEKETVAQPAVQTFAQPTVQQVAQSAVQTFAQPAVQPVAQPAVQTFAQPAVQPVAQPTVQTFAQPAVQPVAQPTVQPVAQPAVQPVAQPAVQTFAQPAVQPVAQPTVQPVAQPAAPVQDNNQNIQ